MTGDDKKDSDELNLTLQDNDGNNSSKTHATKDIIENVLVKKPTLLIDVTPKKQDTEKMDHTSNENIPEYTKSVDEELDMDSEAEIDSDSTIIYDILEIDLTNKSELSANVATPNNSSTPEVETPMASSLLSTDKHTRIVLEKKITPTKLGNKALGLKTKKPGVRETEKVLRTKKDKKQGSSENKLPTN